MVGHRGRRRFQTGRNLLGFGRNTGRAREPVVSAKRLGSRQLMRGTPRIFAFTKRPGSRELPGRRLNIVGRQPTIVKDQHAVAIVQGARAMRHDDNRGADCF